MAGTTRGYGADDDKKPLAGEGVNASSADGPITGGHDSEYAGHGNTGHAGHESAGHGEDDPERVEPSDSTFDDVFITSGGKFVDSAPVGALSPVGVLDNLPPPPVPYKVDLLRAGMAGFVATFTFTPLFYCLFFAFKDSAYDIGLMLGSLVAPQLDWTTRLIGLAIHLFVIGPGIAVTLAYMAYAFRTQMSGGRGVQLGIGLNFAMMGFLLPVGVGVIARYAPGHPQFDNPDFLLNQSGASNLGWEPLVVALLAHMLWGLIFGHLYRHKVLIRQNEHADLAPIAA